MVLVFESAGRAGFLIPVGVKDFCLLQKVQTGSGGASSLLFGGCRGSFLELKRSGRKGNHSPPPTAEVKNEWNYTSISPICLDVMGTDNCYLLLI